MVRRSQRAEQSDDRIRQAALALFCERGFDVTRIEDIAARAGVAKGTVLVHFASKEALFAAVLGEVLDASVARLAAAAAQEGDPEVRLASLAAAMQRELCVPHHGALAWLAIRDAGRCPALARRLDQEWRSRTRRLVSDIISDGIARRRFRPCDPDRIADMLIDPMVLQSIWWHALARHDAGGTAIAESDRIISHYGEMVRLLAPDGG